MTDDGPSGTPDTPLRARPEPTDRRRFSFRIKGVMLAIAVIAAWLAIFREWPSPALAMAWLAGPTAFVYRFCSKEFERDEGRPPGPLPRMVFLFTALMCSASLSLIVVPFLVISLGVIAMIVSLVSR